MPLNQFYHEHGVAQIRDLRSGIVSLRAEHAAEAIRVDHRTRTEQAHDAPASASSTDKFEVFRNDEVQVTSTQFTGGDWRWRLSDVAGNTLVEAGGYRSEQACLVAVSFLRSRANSAT